MLRAATQATTDSKLGCNSSNYQLCVGLQLKRLLTLCWVATGSLPVDFTVYGNIFLRPAASTAVPAGRRRRQLLQSTAEAPAPGQHLDMCWCSSVLISHCTLYNCQSGCCSHVLSLPLALMLMSYSFSRKHQCQRCCCYHSYSYCYCCSYHYHRHHHDCHHYHPPHHHHSRSHCCYHCFLLLLSIITASFVMVITIINIIVNISTCVYLVSPWCLLL